MKGCRALTDDEVSLVAQSFSGTYAARDKALFVLGVKSGFRISELLSLTVWDVWQYGQFVERVAVRRRHMKGKAQGRSVILHPEAKGVLAPWLMILQRGGKVTPDTYLFPSRKGHNRPLRRGQAWHILHHGVSADLLYGCGHIILQSHRRDSVGARGALVEDAVTIDREASATPAA